MKNVFVLAAALLVAACGPGGEDSAAPEAARVQSAAATITRDELLGHIRALSADGLEGRVPERQARPAPSCT